MYVFYCNVIIVITKKNYNLNKFTKLRVPLPVESKIVMVS